MADASPTMAGPEMDNHHTLVETVLNPLIRDDTYAALRAHCFAKGKGRRPTLPSLDAPSYRTFAQLNFLREDGGATWDSVTVWYQKLFPAATVTRGQLEHKVKMVMASLHLKLDDKEEMEATLNTVVDINLHDIPKALSHIGLNRSILLSNNYDFVLPTNFVMSNDIVYSLELFRCQEKQTKTFFCEWVKKLFPTGEAEMPLKDTQIQYRLQKIIKTIKEFKKNKSTDALNNFLSRPFSDSTPTANTKHRPSGETEALSKLRKLEADHRGLAQALCNKDERIEELNLKVKVVREENERLQTMKESLQRQEELTKSILAEKNALEKLNKSLKIERDRLKKSKSKSFQRIYSLQKQNKQQKQEHDLLKMEVQRKNLELNDMNRKIQEVTDTRHEEVEMEIQMLKKKLKSEQTLKSKYKQNLLRAQALSANLLEEVTNKNEKHVQLKVSCTNKYSDNIRLAYMSLQGEANVAAENVRKAVQIVARYLFSTELRDEDLPSPSSALNFMSEALVISNHHITDSLLSSSHFTYATDGTSRQKKRYLEKHVQLDNGKTLFLGYSEIPSDDSQTLLETTIQAFKNLAETALDCSEEPHLEEDTIYKEMISKLKCLMSDRAAVMKCFDNKMAAYKSDLLGEETSTHFLYCNAHFLLGLSSAATDAANNMEFEVKGSGTRLGRDNNLKFASFAQNNEPAVNRALRTTAEVLGPRGDEKNGCREEWLTFLTSRQKTSLFTSYRSNRFNNLFENATALLYHQEDIQAFLTEFTSNSNQKLESILLDISDHNILEFIAALAFYNEMLSTPYWNLMKSTKPYGQFPKYVRLMNNTFQSWMSDDFDLFLSSPVFEDFASQPFILQHLRSGSYDISNVTIFIQQITQQCFIVFERQLHDFLEGGVFGGKIGEEVQQILDTCPLTNLTGERLFGDLDFDMYKRRHATLHLRSSLNMWKRNKTSSYIRRQSDIMRQKLIAKAIRHKTRSKMEKEKQRRTPSSN